MASRSTVRLHAGVSLIFRLSDPFGTKRNIAALNLSPEGSHSGLSGSREGFDIPLVAWRCRHVMRPVVLFSVAPTAEFVVQGRGEHVDAAIVDGDCIGAECASGNRKALVL
jgi:hypothetical protein